MEGEERKKNQSEGEVLVEMAGWILGLSQKCAGVIGRRGFGDRRLRRGRIKAWDGGYGFTGVTMLLFWIILIFSVF